SQDGQTWQTVRRVSAVAISGAASQGQDAAPRLPGPPPPPKRDGGAWRTGGLSASSLAAPRQDGRGLPNLALAPDARALASSVYAGGAMPIHQIRHLNDGWAGNDHSWIANTGGPEWAEIDLGADYWICRVALGNDNSGRFGDRGATTYAILTAREHTEDSSAPQWTRVAQRNGAPLLLRTEITFAPVQARYVRVLLEGSSGEPRLDEVEVYGRPTPLATADVGPLTPEEQPEPTGVTDALLKYAFVGEEHAWLKTYGRADLDPSLVPYNGRVQQYPRHVGDDALPLPRLADGPVVDGELDDAAWALSSRGVARVADPRDFDQGPLVECAVRAGIAGSDLALAIHVDRLLSSHVAVVSAADWQGCGIVTWTEGGLVFRTFTPQGEPAESRPIEGACSDDLTGFELRIPLEWLPGAAGRGVRVGLGLGGLHTPAAGRPVYFRPSDLAVAEEGPCLHGCFRLRLTNTGERPVDVTGTAPALRGGLTLGPGEVRVLDLASASGPIGPELDVTLVEPGREAYELHLFRYDPLERTLDLMEGIADRLEAAGLEVARERRQVSELRARQEELLAAAPDRSAERQVLWEARVAKRDLLLRDPDLAVLDRVLFAKRFAYWPSHIYTDYTDAPFRPGGGVYALSIPRPDGRLAPERGQLVELFDGRNGIVRDPAPTFDAQRIYFGYRPSADGFYHIMT
ncbi:MAG TPA: discoidin domain-containing protein, partial [Armatimonadota bacterium]|nr:discoidin domain-containing protein [Armatimonadota bacterium]